MSVPFDPANGLIVVSARLTGPTGSTVARLALDTGATESVISVAPLVFIGYDPALAADLVQVTTGSGVDFAPRVRLERIAALGQVRTDFPVLSHTLPPSAGVDGLLGLDFFRGKVLTIDFEKGEVSLTPQCSLVPEPCYERSVALPLCSARYLATWAAYLSLNVFKYAINRAESCPHCSDIRTLLSRISAMTVSVVVIAL
jgi:hypothetical protein